MKPEPKLTLGDKGKPYEAWFAWRPVLTPDGWKWLCMVGRRWSTDGPGIEYHCWEYR